MRQIFILFIVSCFFCSVVNPQALADVQLSYEQCLQEANRALDRRDHLKAIEYLKQAHQVAPSFQYPLEKIKAIQDLIRKNQMDRPDKTAALYFYQKFAKLGKDAFEKGQYQEASYYFHRAYLIIQDSQQTNAENYINLIKRTQEGMIRGDKLKSQAMPLLEESDQSAEVITPQISVEPQLTQKLSEASLPNQKTKSASKKSIPKISKSNKSQREVIISLDEVLWQSQPKTDLQIDKGSSLVLEGRDIDRFLVITPGILDIERLDRDRLRLTAMQVGTTFIHVWDNRGRWTFNVQVKFPQLSDEIKPEVPTVEKHADPFRFTYSMDGGSLYLGKDIQSAKRDSLNMQQTLAIKGETPVGIVDGAVGYYKFKESTEATNYTVGLSGVKGLGFSNVNFRGYDAVKYFSALTFPGQYFRGFLMEGNTWNDHLGMVYLHGQDRFTYSYISPGIVEDRRSYVEGARVTVNPYAENQYTVNYARGYGEARQTFLKNEVYSVEAQRRIDPVLLKGEVATNKDTLAETLSARMGNEGRSFYAHFRDIDKDFTTVTSLPSNQGEVGVDLGTELDYEFMRINTSLDLYRDRFLPNADNPRSLNYDWNGAVTVPISESLSLLSTAYYLDTPGELSPRQNFRWMNTLSKRFKVLNDRDLTMFIGASYHRNRLKETPVSEYDRYSATSGLQINLIEHLNYFANYEYSWVDELLTGNVTQPGVLNTGLSYSRELTKKTSMSSSFYYRDEQNALGVNSFLAGEDSITGSLGFNYRPRDGSELFLDGRLRNVWKENPDNPAYNEIDVRWGVRSAWDLPFSWSPVGKIQGVVFKDLDADGYRGPQEPGIAGVHIRVGKKEVVSDKNGRYKARLMAKEVVVSADAVTIPNGYVLTTPPIREVKIPYSKDIDFGFTAQSGIYGIFYYDLNKDHKPSEGDEFIQKAKIVLDGINVEASDYDGTYFFKNVSPGRHTLRIDVPSLPFEYLPLVKLSNSVDITEGTVYVFHVPLSKKNIPKE